MLLLELSSRLDPVLFSCLRGSRALRVEEKEEAEIKSVVDRHFRVSFCFDLRCIDFIMKGEDVQLGEE